MTKIAILQPSYIPWIGYFEQILNVDIFIFYDDVQYTKNDWRNRNKIKTKDDSAWLTIPVKCMSNQKINEVIIDNSKIWQEKHLKSIKQYYSKSLYFEEIFPILKKNIKSKEVFLHDISINIIKDLLEYLHINTKIYSSSQLNINGDKNTRLINICKYFNADIYYSGQAAREYLDIEQFNKNDIKVMFQDYIHPEYNQLNGKFKAYLSIIDLLFNYGKNSIEIIRSN